MGKRGTLNGLVMSRDRSPNLQHYSRRRDPSLIP